MAFSFWAWLGRGPAMCEVVWVGVRGGEQFAWAAFRGRRGWAWVFWAGLVRYSTCTVRYRYHTVLRCPVWYRLAPMKTQ